ncbi:hypothetical protein O1M54_03875 [Streptomyces diastatochromogenes]|nr:hypothetical protein [Streptomyces diastatochromogenes]
MRQSEPPPARAERDHHAGGERAGQGGDVGDRQGPGPAEDQFGEGEGEEQLGDARPHRQIERRDVQRHRGAQQGQPQRQVGGDATEPFDPQRSGGVLCDVVEEDDPERGDERQ